MEKHPAQPECRYHGNTAHRPPDKLFPARCRRFCNKKRQRNSNDQRNGKVKAVPLVRHISGGAVDKKTHAVQQCCQTEVEERVIFPS